MKKYIISSIVIIILSACHTKVDESTKEVFITPNSVELTDAQFKNSKIETGKIEQKAISSILKVNGKIDVPPQNMVAISAPLGGYLKSTSLLEGMHISKGEVIAVMEDQQYIQLQQDYLTAKAYLSSLEKEFQRQKELNESKASSDKVFENAQAQYISQKVLIKSLSEKLKLISINPDNLNENTISRSINIYSPIDGYVTVINMSIGKYASPTDVLFELVNPEDIHLALTVFEKDVDKLFIGQKIVAYNNQSTKKYTCEIILVGKSISLERAIEVHCHFDQYDKSLIPGMFMNAEIETITNKAFVISTNGLVQFEGKHYVFSEVQPQKYLMEEVIALNSDNGFTQISFINNVAIENKIFVTNDAYTLLMKMKNTEE
jgi:cobalt-zinc-cadmium efflux system membrane fusion protein